MADQIRCSHCNGANGLVPSGLLLAVLSLLAVAASAGDTTVGQLTVKKPKPPTDEECAKVRPAVEEVYGHDLKSTDTYEQLRAAASKLFEKAATSDQVSRYVILQTVKERAIELGDGTLAYQAVDEIRRSFDIDPLACKADVLEGLSRRRNTQRGSTVIAEQALLLSSTAMRAGRVDIASTLLDLAIKHARFARSPELGQRVAAQRKELAAVVSTLNAASKAERIIEHDPGNEAANLAIGKYKCLVRGEWDQGLPMLALGGGDPLSVLAASELKDVAEASRQVEHGDTWWGLSEKADGIEAERLRDRAVHWYVKALPSLSGLAKDRIQKRIAPFLDSLELEVLMGSWDVSIGQAYKAVWTFHSDGTVASTAGAPAGKWTLEKDRVYVKWPQSWETFERPIRAAGITGSSWSRQPLTATGRDRVKADAVNEASDEATLIGSWQVTIHTNTAVWVFYRDGRVEQQNPKIEGTWQMEEKKVTINWKNGKWASFNRPLLKESTGVNVFNQKIQATKMD